MIASHERFPKGLIVKGVGGLYYVHGDDGTRHILRAKGIFRKRKMIPLVGDEILYSPSRGDEHGWVEEILPRRNVLVRPPVANISTVILVLAPQPAPDFLLLDTLLIMAREQQIHPVLVINKCDLGNALSQEVRHEYDKLRAPVLEVSAKSGAGLNALRQIMREGICCFAGQSGVGKSTLLCAVTGLELETGEISRKTSRGKHTTRHAELMVSGDYRVLDTPGFSLLELWDRMEPVELQAFYPEFEAYEGKCKFSPCYHSQEPGCAVLTAVEKGELSQARVERYHVLLAKVQKAWRDRYE